MLGTAVNVATLPATAHGAVVDLSNASADVVMATIPASKFSVAWCMMLVVAIESLYFLLHSTSIQQSSRTMLCTGVAKSTYVYVMSLPRNIKAVAIMSGYIMIVSAFMVLLFGSQSIMTIG